jgi:hypothetical protein
MKEFVGNFGLDSVFVANSVYTVYGHSYYSSGLIRNGQKAEILPPFIMQIPDEYEQFGRFT